MIIQAGTLIEIRPVNNRVAKREFVPFHQIVRVFLDDAFEPGTWGAQLIDGTYVALLDEPRET